MGGTLKINANEYCLSDANALKSFVLQLTYNTLHDSSEPNNPKLKKNEDQNYD